MFSHIFKGVFLTPFGSHPPNFSVTYIVYIFLFYHAWWLVIIIPNSRDTPHLQPSSVSSSRSYGLQFWQGTTGQTACWRDGKLWVEFMEKQMKHMHNGWNWYKDQQCTVAWRSLSLYIFCLSWCLLSVRLKFLNAAWCNKVHVQSHT